MPCFVPPGLEVRAGRLEVRWIAFTRSVDVEPMSAGRKFLGIHSNPKPFSTLRQCCYVAMPTCRPLASLMTAFAVGADWAEASPFSSWKLSMVMI